MTTNTNTRKIRIQRVVEPSFRLSQFLGSVEALFGMICGGILAVAVLYILSAGCIATSPHGSQAVTATAEPANNNINVTEPVTEPPPVSNVATGTIAVPVTSIETSRTIQHDASVDQSAHLDQSTHVTNISSDPFSWWSWILLAVLPVVRGVLYGGIGYLLFRYVRLRLTVSTNPRHRKKAHKQ